MALGAAGPESSCPIWVFCVRLSNEAVARSERRVDYVHMPVIRRAEAEFFAPLDGLDIAGTKVFLGLIHHDDDPETFRTQLALAASYLDDFGIAGPCGYGRAPSENLPDVLRTHAHGVDELRRSRAGVRHNS